MAVFTHHGSSKGFFKGPSPESHSFSHRGSLQSGGCRLFANGIRLMAWCGQCFLQIPPKPSKAKVDTAPWNSSFGGPLSERLSLSFKDQDSVRASIASLFRPCSPTTIRRLIAAIVIDSIERVLHGRTWADIRQEVIKRISPAFANGDAPTSVGIKSTIGSVKAPSFHVEPNPIFTGLAHAVRFPHVLNFTIVKAV